MKLLPKIPKAFFSTLGALPITWLKEKHAAKKGLLGQYDWCARHIYLRKGMAPSSEWMVLWHEAIHVALMDSGVHANVLTKEQEEAVCDAVGNYLTAMMLTGWLTFTVPKSVRKL